MVEEWTEASKPSHSLDNEVKANQVFLLRTPYLVPVGRGEGRFKYLCYRSVDMEVES